MKTYKRLIIFFLLCVLLIGIMTAMNQLYEVKQIETLAKEELTNKQQMMNDLLTLENQSIRKLLDDYSNWDDMANFVIENKQEWPTQNIDTLTDTLNVPYIWIFNANQLLVHSRCILEPKEEMIHLLTRDILLKAFENKHTCHFFIPTSNGITEIMGSIITYYAKDPTKVPVHGYLIIGRVWDKALIDSLSNLGSYFKAEMELSTSPFPFDFNNQTSLLQISKPLFDPYGKVVSYLGIRIPSDTLRQFYRVIRRYYYIGSISIGLFLLLLLYIFFSWIFPPLRLLSETLVMENTDRLKYLKNDTSEFGEMAKLMISFFQQKKMIQQEIEEKRAALEELKQSEEHFRVLSETLPCFVLILQDNKIQYANTRFCLQFDFIFFELIQKDFFFMVHPDYHKILQQKIASTQEDPLSFAQLEVPVISKTGNLIWLELSLGKTLFHNHSAVIVSGFDITERKKVQKELENTLQIKSNFTSMTSHELRTPLAAIKGAIDIVSDPTCGELNHDQQTTLQIAKRNVDRLHRLINDILDFQKLESGNTIFHFEIIDLEEVVEETTKTMTPLLTEKKLTLTSIIPKDLPPVKADRDRITQVFINLMNNAIKFTQQGKIALKCCVSGDFVQVTIQDTGIGIRKEDIDKLFQQYSQITTNSLQKYPGTGLGLAICKEIINRHLGQITVKSEVGIGTSIMFTLPISA